MEHRMREWLRLYRELALAERELASDGRNPDKRSQVKQLQQRCSRALEALQSAARLRGTHRESMR